MISAEKKSAEYYKFIRNIQIKMNELKTRKSGIFTDLQPIPISEVCLLTFQ